MARSIGVRDIAREAGVSPSTVSRALSGRVAIGDETRERILDVANRLGYRYPATPSSASSRAVALLVPTLSNPFYGELAEGALGVARTLGYHLLLVSTEGDGARQRDEVDALRSRGVDAILLTTASDCDEQIATLAREGFPLVLLAREAPDLGVSCVTNDDHRGAELATQHLLDLGHRHIAAIAESSAFAGAPGRVRGYRAAMERAGLAESVEVVEVRRADVEAGREAALALLTTGRTTAILAHNDLVALGVLEACEHLGRSVPDDVSVVGYDGTILARVSRPPLTTVAQPTREIGAIGVELAHQLLETTVRVRRTVVLQPELLVGKTSAPVFASLPAP